MKPVAVKYCSGRIRQQASFSSLEKARGEGMAEDEMFERHHRLKRHEFEQTPGDSEGLVCCYVATKSCT